MSVVRVILGTRECAPAPRTLLEREVDEVVRVRDAAGGGISEDRVEGVKLNGALGLALLAVFVAGVGVGVDADDGVDDDGTGAASTAALIARWTVSPSLSPSYSFNSRSSAIALPLYSQRCRSGSGAPLALFSPWS